MKNKESKKSKKVTALIICFVVLGLAGAGTYFISNYIKENTCDSVVKNNKALYVGCPLSVDSSDGSTYPVQINVEIHTEGIDYSNSWNTDSNRLDFIQDEDYKDIGWINLTSTFSNLSNVLDVDVFVASSEENYITLQSVWLGYEEISSEVKTIDDSGLWFINVATEEGGTVQTSHSYVYTTYTWDLSYLKEDN